MTNPRLDALIRDRLGLDPGSLGETAFRGAIGHRMTARRVATPESYAGLLTTDPGEWAVLAGELVVPETWFFRGGRPLFDHLAEWIAARRSRPVRVLSLPCSTGEEPFSLAIALWERGVPTAGYQIDAVDLAASHLARAAAGRFAASSFREPDSDPRPRHFRPTDDGRWELGADVRAAVRFRSGNAIEPGLLAGEPPYDLIVCRNLFIYLTPEARERVVANFERLLAADGLLCVSPTEAARVPRARFAPDGPPAFCLLRRAGSGSRAESSRPNALPSPRWGEGGEAQPSRVRGSRHTGLPSRPSPPAPLPSGERGERAATFAEPPRAPEVPPDPFAAARALADAGRLDEALAAHAAAARTHTSADGFCLLGTIELARGRTDEAARAFRNALYLDPDHATALSHMIVLCRQRGELDRADALRRRLARVEREDRP